MPYIRLSLHILIFSALEHKNRFEKKQKYFPPSSTLRKENEELEMIQSIKLIQSIKQIRDFTITWRIFYM